MWRRLSVGLLIFVGVASLCGLVSYLLLHRGDPPANWRNPPLYPGAGQVAVQDFGEWGKMQPGSLGRFVVKVISFTVPGRVQQVRDFYEEAYSGWDRDDDGWGTDLPATDRLNYSTFSRLVRSPSIYYVHVLTEEATQGETRVTIGVTVAPGY